MRSTETEEAQTVGRRKRLLLTISGSLFLLAAGVAVFLYRSPGPTLNGRTLLQWFKQPELNYIHLMPDSPAGPGDKNEAHEAILELRGDAVPLLLNAAERRPGVLQRFYYNSFRRVPPRLQRILPSARNPEAIRQDQQRALTMLGSLIYWDKHEGKWGQGRPGIPYPKVIATLRRCLRDPDPNVRSIAATASGYLGKDGRTLVPDLTRIVRDTNSTERLAAASALARVGTHEVVPDLLSLLSPGAGEVSTLAIDAFATLGSQASNAVPRLIELIPAARDPVRARIAQTLGFIGDRSPEVQTALTAIVKSQDQFSQRAAALAFVRLGATPAGALPVLCNITNSGDVSLRQAGTLALWNWDREEPELVRAVESAVLLRPFAGLIWMHQAGLDGRATSLAPLLQQLTTNAEPSVRRSATNLLQRIEGR